MASTRLLIIAALLGGCLLFGGCQVTAIPCATGDPACNPLETLVLYDDYGPGEGECITTTTRVIGGSVQSCTPVEPVGSVTTLAGMAGSGTFADGTGTAAAFNLPLGTTTDGTYVYVADRSNNRIRRVDPVTAEVITFAGSGAASTTDGVGTAATFNQPSSITTDGTYLYVAQVGSGAIRRIEIASQTVTTLATGFTNPVGIVVSGAQLYVADLNDNNVYKIER